MRLLCDDYNQVYVWVNSSGEAVSPHFDYEEDAINWFKNWATIAKLANVIHSKFTF